MSNNIGTKKVQLDKMSKSSTSFKSILSVLALSVPKTHVCIFSVHTQVRPDKCVNRS